MTERFIKNSTGHQQWKYIGKYRPASQAFLPKHAGEVNLIPQFPISISIIRPIYWLAHSLSLDNRSLLSLPERAMQARHHVMQ